MAQITILFLSANPKKYKELHLIEECKRIRSKIESAKFANQFKLEQEHKCSVYELQELLGKTYTPQIVHFSGHGKQGFLLLQDEEGEVEEAKLKPFAKMFEILNNRATISEEEKIRCVVLNACYSQKIAEAVANHVDCVIGTPGDLGDKAARVFAESFYLHLCSGESVEDAFILGCNQVGMANLVGQGTPKLMCKIGCNAKKIMFVSETGKVTETSKPSDSHDGPLINPPENDGTAVSSESRDVDAVAWHNKGRDLFNVSRFEESIDCFDRALDINPRYADVYIDKGCSLEKLGRLDESLRCFDRALDINPRYALARNNKGIILRNLGRYDESLVWFDKVLESNPRYAAAWVEKGISLANLGRYSEAIDCQDMALKIDPQYTMAWYSKGSNLYNLGRFYEAINCFDRALDINPRYGDAYIYKGCSLDKLGRYNEAIYCYDRALDINQRDALAWYDKGSSLNGLGRYSEAIECHNKALDINPQYVDAWISKGFSLNNLGRYSEAIACQDKALETNPQHVLACFNKGCSLRNLGRFDEAIDCFDRALKINPQYADAWYEKALVEDKLGLGLDASKSLQEFIKVAPAEYTEKVTYAHQRLHELEGS